MPLLVPSRLLWARLAALLFTCVAFSAASHGGQLGGVMADWPVVCWVVSFCGTLLVLLVEGVGLQSRAPVSWSNFPITFSCYAALLCLSASVLFPLFFLRGEQGRGEGRDHRITSSVFSCLATVAYLLEVCEARARPGEVAGYMATAPGLLKVCETFTAGVIFLFVSDYHTQAALKWCLAVYCVCFVLSAGVVLLCVGECTGRLPFPFSRFLSAYALAAVALYLSATVVWPVFQLEGRSSRPDACRYTPVWCPWDRWVAVSVLTGLNLLLYLADLAYSAQLVFVRA